jgi:protein-tyrosine phosphatase
MPGRYEKFTDFTKEVEKLKLYKIVCLTDKNEIKGKSPEYLSSVETGILGDIKIDYNPVPDYGIPVEEKDIKKYESTLNDTYQILKVSNVLIHCAGGIGRTGTFAVMLLKTAGFTFEEALKIVKGVGSKPETPEQMEFCCNGIR